MELEARASDFLGRLRGRGLVVLMRCPQDGSLPARLVVTPGSGLTEADRQELKQHREALLDLLAHEVKSPWQDVPLGWPHNSPRWDGESFTRRPDQ